MTDPAKWSDAELFERIQWNATVWHGGDPNGVPACPCCGAKKTAGHVDGCELAKRLPKRIIDVLRAARGVLAVAQETNTPDFVERGAQGDRRHLSPIGYQNWQEATSRTLKALDELIACARLQALLHNKIDTEG